MIFYAGTAAQQFTQSGAGQQFGCTACANPTEVEAVANMIWDLFVMILI
ncbi:MAG: hypothetical protein CM1200mP28_11150 [Deltaproteobacteria bacterium]|nr:MAG: hypothetical protein CM1200mP28_11150 [Deltaproteobacteria bacterium]